MKLAKVLNTNRIGKLLNAHGFGFFAGVPCSYLQSLINYAVNDQEYITAANEGDAVAICAGATLGGRKSVVLMQNSGLTNATSPLTSLIYTFGIPILGFVSLRGDPEFADEPQHELMGQITTGFLDLMRVPWTLLSRDMDEAVRQIEEADAVIKSGRPFFFVVRKDTFEETTLKPQVMNFPEPGRLVARTRQEEVPPRIEVLETLHRLAKPDCVLLATTGKTGRELHEVEDAPNNLYMVGSMGCVSSLGLGLALARKDRKIVAIDGDGAILMRAGAMSALGYYRPANLLHILLDNGTHDSTGGQATVSGGIAFPAIAGAMGYPHAVHVHDLDELRAEFERWHQQGGLTFLYCRIAKGSKKNLGRPGLTPKQVRTRLEEFLR